MRYTVCCAVCGILCIVQCAVYCVLCSVQYLQAFEFENLSVHCALSTAHCNAMQNVVCVLNAYYEVCIAHFAVRYKVCSNECSGYNNHCSLYTVHCKFSNAHSTLRYTVYIPSYDLQACAHPEDIEQ